MTTCCFLLSVFFSKAKQAVVFCMVMWIDLYIPYFLTLKQSYKWKLLACISTNTALAYAFDAIFYEFQGAEEKQEWYIIMPKIIIFCFKIIFQNKIRIKITILFNNNVKENTKHKLNLRCIRFLTYGHVDISLQ